MSDEEEKNKQEHKDEAATQKTPIVSKVGIRNRRRKAIRRGIIIFVVVLAVLFGSAIILVKNLSSLSIQEAAADGKITLIRLHLLLGTDIDAVNQDSDTALTKAVVYGQEDAVKFLLEEGANQNPTPTDFRINDSLLHIICHNLYHSGNEREIYNIASMLIEYDANLNTFNSNKTTPLGYAIRFCSADVVELFLKNGADPNLADAIAVFGLPSLTITPLLTAISNQRYDIAKMLLDYGADINQTISSSNPSSLLLHLIYSNNVQSVRFLLENGADPNHDECLSGPIWGNQPEILSLLLEHGANANQIINNEGTSPLDCALSKGNEEIIEILKKAGAKTGEELEKEAAEEREAAKKQAATDSTGETNTNETDTDTTSQQP